MSYFTRPDKVTDKLHVITTVFNPKRYRSRWTLYKKFEQHIMDLGAELHVVEASYGSRDNAIKEESLEEYSGYKTVHGTEVKPTILRIQTNHMIWIKENLINLAIQRLPLDWKYVAWIDADVHFARPDIIGETIQQLQHYQIVQMWSEAQDLDSTYNPFMRHKSFAYCHLNGVPKTSSFEPGYYDSKVVPGTSGVNFWHPGFAVAARREAIDHLGCLIDFAILGAGDNSMMKCLVGDGKFSVHPDMSQAYLNKILEWENRAELHIRRNIGYVDGLLLHNWHGSKTSRQYWDRWKILTESKFDPEYDLKKDWQGVYQLVDRQTPRSIKLRDQIRGYFSQRNEDDLYLPETERKM